MERSDTSRALRWCVTRVDTSLLVLEYVGNEIFGYALAVDTAQRVVRSGTRTPIKLPLAEKLPDDAELVHASQLEDSQLAMPMTLLVFQCRAGQTEGDAVPRPTKRVRREPPGSAPNGDATASTRLLLFALTSGDAGDWALQPLGDVTLPGAPSALHIHVVDGPSIVAFNAATSELSLLQTSVTDEGDYAFAVTYTGLTLPGTSKVELLSCQLVDEELTTTPHLLLQYAESQQQLQEDDEVALGWQHTSEQRRRWATLPLHHDDSFPVEILPCTYLPRVSAIACEVGVAEQITSCAFVAPPSSNVAVRHQAIPAPSTLSSEAPRLHASAVLLVGTSNSTLLVSSNGTTLASYVVAGVPHRIKVANPHQDSGSAIVAVVSSLDVDRPFHVLSIDVWGDRKSVVVPLQHFTHVGSSAELVFEDAHRDESRMLLLNDVDSRVKEGDFLTLALRKSVIVSCFLKGSGHATSTCHRLKHRTDEKTSKKRGGGRDEPSEGSHTIERVKIDKRERDFDADSRNATSHSSASEQQLGMLTKSLEERLRIGCVQTDRLERVCGEKMEMVLRLNDLLARRYNVENVPIGPFVHEASPLSLIRVVGQDQSIEEANAAVLVTQPCYSLQRSATLDDVSIVSFEHSSSILRLLLDIHAEHHAGADGTVDIGMTARHTSVYATNSSGAMRSWSRVRQTLPPLPGRGSQCRMRLEVHVEVPPSYRRLRSQPIDLGLWLRMASPAPSGMEASTSPVATCFLGEVNADLASLAKKSSRGHPVGFDAKTSDNCIATRDEYLVVSRGSSVREAIATTQASSDSLRFVIVRPLFCVVAIESEATSHGPFPDDHAFGELLRALPSDVVALVNPLSKVNLEMVQGFIRLLQIELDQLFVLDTRQRAEKEEASEVDQNVASVARTQRRTDLQALRLLNDLQRRIDFHGLLSTAASH